MTPLEELAAKLRTFWLRDIGASSSSTDASAAADGSVALGRTFFIPAAGGLVGINQIPTDPYALDVSGHTRIAGNLYARAGNSWNMGADGTPWGAIYASELHVGNLIAENKIATTGGRILVSPSTKVILAMTTGATTIDVAANTLTSGDRIYLESTGKLEWMAVTSGATAVTGGYRYSVTRNLNGAGAQTWSAGDAVVNTGQTGQGFIDLYSRYGIPANGQTSTTRQGPTIVGNVRTGSTFDSIAERWAVGNLKGLYDYGATAYGFAAGDPQAAWLALDATNGLRMMQSSETRVQLTAAGVLTINNSDSQPVFTFDSAVGAEFTLPLTLATTGGIYQGTGTFASPTTGLKIYNSGGFGLIAGYNTGTVQWYADTDGKLYAGAGAVKLDDNGITLNKGTGYAAASSIKWGGDDISVTGYYSLATNRLFLLSQQLSAGAYAQSNLQASGGTSGGGIGQVYIVATGDGALASVAVQSNLGITMVGAVGITGNVTLTGSFGIRGATSGTATIVAPAVAGTPTLTLPTSTGTLALTSDITTAISGTSGTLTKFTGTNSVGNSIITESGAAISVAGTATIVGSSNTNQFVVKSHSTQTAGQIVIQTSAAAELARIYVLANYSMGIGYLAGQSVTGANNLAIGPNALKTQTSGTTNIAIGQNALENLNSSGHDNTAIGYYCLKALTSGQYNFAIGSTCLYLATTAINNCAYGTNACLNVVGSGNCGIGVNTLYYSSSVADNVAVGWAAGLTCGGDRNTLIGTWAGYSGGGSAVAFSDSVYVGNKSGYGSNVGSYNVAVGGESLQKAVTGATAIGYKAGYVATGAGQVLIGYQAGVAVTTGTNNTIVGYQAGASLSTNGGSVMIGYQAGKAETAANKLYIANSSTTTPLIYGDFSTPSLTFNGTVNIADAKNIVLGTTTGSKLGSGATEKLGVWGATPIVQPTTAVAAATFTANAGTAVNDASTFDGYTIKQVVKALRNAGWLA